MNENTPRTITNALDAEAVYSVMASAMYNGQIKCVARAPEARVSFWKSVLGVEVMHFLASGFKVHGKTISLRWLQLLRTRGESANSMRM